MGRILMSVTDKTGIEKFEALTRSGWTIISTGGTAKKLAELSMPYTPVEGVTNLPEMLDGRLKTLHHIIFGGILADRRKPDHLQQLTLEHIDLIDLMVGNLYNFEGDPGIEQIDIGGPALIRAAAKNGASIAAVVDPQDYDMVIRELLKHGRLSESTREELAIKVFLHTARYDRMIAHWMLEQKRLRQPIFNPIVSAH